jgi:hypothetical protein
MTSGGIFTLIANDGKADNLIYATKLLNTRIAQIKNSNKDQEDTSPTLSEIERTHMLFVNAHFKPFVMIGFEYMKSRPTTAGMKLNVDSNSLLKYNIPQFGDFFSDMALSARIKKIKDSGSYKYRIPQANGMHPVWKLCTKLANGDEHVNYAVSMVGGTVAGVVTNATYKDNDDTNNSYTYKTYSRPPKEMSWVHRTSAVEGGVTTASITTPDLAVLAMTCFVNNPNDLGVNVANSGGSERVFPWEMADSWTSALVTTGPSSEPDLISNLAIGGWAEMENIWVARGYVVTGGHTGGVSPPTLNADVVGSAGNTPTANIQQGTGYMYYSGLGTSTTAAEVPGYNSLGSRTNVDVHNAATNTNQLSVKDAAGNVSFGKTMYVRVDWVQGYCDSDGMCVPADINFPGGTKWAKQLRFAENPGHRLIKDVKFTVNNNILDQYNTEVYNMYEKFMIKSEKKVGYQKLIGQQIPMVGNGEDNSSGAHQLTEVVDGNQVPKMKLDGTYFLWVPLLFWFSKDFRLSIPSVSIPFGQRNIDVTLASLKELVHVVPAKVFRVHKSKRLYSKLLEQDKQALFFGTSYDSSTHRAMSAVDNSRNPVYVDCTKIQVQNEDYSSGSADNLTNDEIDIDLYINNLFVTPEIHDIFIKRVGFNLIRVYVQQEISLTAQSNELLLSSLKWPIEYLCVGVKPNVNRNHPDNWHKYETIEDKMLPQRHTGEWGDSINMIKYSKGSPILESFGIKAHGVSLFDDTFTSKFYNAYLPWKYGADIVTPKDDGVYMVNFCLYPGDYQPSGHINVSRAREFYFKYNTVSSFIPAETNSVLHIIASAINFLLISDGSAVLRYTT